MLVEWGREGDQFDLQQQVGVRVQLALVLRGPADFAAPASQQHLLRGLPGTPAAACYLQLNWCAVTCPPPYPTDPAPHRGPLLLPR